MPPPPPQLCRHCGREPVTRPRGLGWKCYYAPGVRDLYPVLPTKFNRRGVGHKTRGDESPPAPTAGPPGSVAKLAELEARAAAGQSLWHDGDAGWDAWPTCPEGPAPGSMRAAVGADNDPGGGEED